MLKSWFADIKSRFPAYVFTRIYVKRRWKGESASGAGSSHAQTRVVREVLPPLLKEIGAVSLLDIPCGDLHWMKEIDLGEIHYIGADIVRPLIEHNRQQFANTRRCFEVVNLISDPLPQADVVFCRDCMVHLSNKDVRSVLDNIRKSGAKWLIATTYTGGDRINSDIRTGQWRAINLTCAPFNLPPPLTLVNEHCSEDNGRFADKYLAVWRVSDLR